MSSLSGLVEATHRLHNSLRSTLSHNRRLALARTQVRALSLGRKLVVDRGSQTVTAYDDDRAVRMSTQHTGDVWEAVNDLRNVYELALPNGEWRGPDGRLRPLLDISRPTRHTLRRSGQTYLFTALPESDATNELYLELAQLEPGAVVFDCGAYCGASTCAFAEAVGATGQVVAFEPDSANFAALKTNLEEHAATNVRPHMLGIWSTSTTLRFVANGNMGSRISNESSALTGPVSSVQTTSLADAYRKEGLSRLDFVKMDIEGAEIAALESARELLQATRPRLVVEAHMVDGTLATRRLMTLFDEIGFRAMILLENEHSPYHLIYASPRARA